MLNVTINNSVKTSVDAGAAEYANTQEDGANEELSFLATLTQISNTDTRKETSKTDISTQTSNTDTSKETSNSISTYGEQQPEDDDTNIESLSENEIDAVPNGYDESDAHFMSETSEADDEIDLLSDTEQTSKHQNQSSAGDLLAQINAANQQKTDVTRYQTDEITAKEDSRIVKSGKNISKIDFKTESIEKPVDRIITPPWFDAMSVDEELSEQQDGTQYSDGKGKVISSLTESHTKHNKAEALADGQEKASDKAVKSEQALLQQAQINAADEAAKNAAAKVTPIAATVKNDANLSEQQFNTPPLKKNELAQQVSDIAKQIGEKATQGSAQDNKVPAELKATLEQQLSLLSPKERSALQQGLQQLSKEGKASPLVEQALQQLKELDESQVSLTKQSPRGDVTVGVNAAALAGGKNASYNSTKVDKDAAKQDVKVLQKAMNSVDGDSFHSDIKREVLSVGQLAQAMPSPQVEQLFKVIAAPIQTNSPSSQFSELVQYLEQLDAAPQNTQSQQLNSTSQKVQVDAQMLQAVNIARNDAAKILQEKVSMMLNLNNQEAEIRLDPRELGSMQIRIRTDAEQAQVNFVVQNQQAKDLLEQSMPKLREMLAEQGIELGQSNIEQGSEGQQEQMFGSHDEGQANSGLAEQSEQGENTSSQASGSLNDGSSIDYYA
ncbi:flagellar hook-length control protein FliK [Pseudoalteromonas byunsanensis]|nr:flagellar hook-length control protein FliK [Pseudoalteromonas byunsanensis]